MKANAPERIWIDPANDLPKLSGHIDKDSVEYIRKDAFIEKAKKWFEHCKKSWYNEWYIDGEYNRDRQFKEPVSEELEEASFDYAEACKYDGGEKLLCVEHFRTGAEWQKEHLWKPADGDDLKDET